MARILIADEPDGAAFLQRLLAQEHELVFVSSMKEALNALTQQDFDLIVIGVHFDDSQMFELMRECQRIPNTVNKPIICFCTRDTPLTRTMHESIEVSAKALGAWMYLDQHDYNVKKNPDAELRRVIERCLVSTARKKNQQKRQEIQTERRELLRLRHALEDQEWTVDLEDHVADLRQKLSQVLLELAKVQINSVNQHEKLAQSKDLDDRVSEQVRLSENQMGHDERQLTREEGQQLAMEQEIVPIEEEKGKKGRRKLSENREKKKRDRE